MSEVITLQKDDIGLWKMAGKAFPESQLQIKLAEFLDTDPRPKFENDQVYHLPMKGMPESVVDALFYLRGEGHAMYCPAVGSDRKEEHFEIDRPIYELIIELLMTLLKRVAGLGKGGKAKTPGAAGPGMKPRRGQPLIGYDGGLEL